MDDPTSNTPLMPSEEPVYGKVLSPPDRRMAIPDAPLIPNLKPSSRAPSRRGSSHRRSRPRTNKSTFLYRYFDEDDELLYIGITDNLADRTHEHAWSSSWMDFAVRSTIERYKTRKEAEELEVQAIRSERPLFNMAHNDAPGAERRLIDYLIDHDRRDLLAVAVSRG